MKLVHMRIAALAVAALWLPSPQTIQWMIEGGEIPVQVFEEIRAAMIGAFGRTDRQANANVDDPDAPRKFAILAAAEAARFWGGYSLSLRHAGLAYATSKFPYVPDDVSQRSREGCLEEFVAAILTGKSSY